jgi:hypothetical protein
MRSTIALVALLAVACSIGPAAASDAVDDFTNNLFTDLAP